MKPPQSLRLSAPRRDSLAHRTGRLADGVDDRQRGTRSSRSPIPAAGRVAARAGTPPNAAPRGRVVLRPPRRRRKGAAAAEAEFLADDREVFGVRRWIRPPKLLRGSRIR